MKCKVNESPSSGLGRPRTSLISAVHSSSRNKINNNDVSAVRRSSRRATIERRIWAVPKKGNKFSGTTTTQSAKKKENIQSKRDRKPCSNEKIEVKSNNKNKGSSGIKRGVSPSEDSELPRKKARKKLPGEDVKLVSKTESSEAIDKTHSEGQCDKHFHNLDETVSNEGSSSIESSCTKVTLECETLENANQETFPDGDERTRQLDGLDSEKVDLADTSQRVNTDSKCDIGKEETLCIDDICLHKAVIVEVVSDYGRSDVKETYTTDLALKDDISEKVVSHKVLEVDGDICKDRHKNDKSTRSLDSSSPKDIWLDSKSDSVGSLLSDMDKYPIRPEKSRKFLKVEPNWTSVISSGIKGEGENFKVSLTTGVKAASTLDSCSVKSMHKPSFDEGSDNSSIEGPSGLCEVRKKVESDKDTRSGSSLHVFSEPKPHVKDSPVTKSKDSFSKANRKDLIFNGDTLKVESKAKCDLQSKELGVLTDTDTVQNGFSRKPVLSEKQSVKLTGDKLGHSYILVDVGDTKVAEKQSLNLQQINSGFDPGGVHRTELHLNDCKELLSETKISAGSLSHVNYKNSDKKTIKDSVTVLAKPVDQTCKSLEMRGFVDQTCKSLEVREGEFSEEYSDKEIGAIEKSSGICDSGNVHEGENACIPELDSSCKTGDSLKVCSQTKSCLVPLELDVSDMEVGEEGHVSLSVALAQLVDAGSPDEADGAETLTIHSAAALTQVSEERKEVVSSERKETLVEERKEIITEERSEVLTEERKEMVAKVESDTEDQGKREVVNEEEIEEDEGKLFIKEDEEEEIVKLEEDREVETECQEEQEEAVELVDQLARCTADPDEGDLVGSEETPHDSSVEKATKVDGEVQPLNLQKPKKQIPPLIKISTRPPTIKTPLKCPECPMQFCTVRSLFWHFGLHGARSQEMSLPPILLQDLLVPWDKASTSRFLSQAQELLDKAEKSLQVQEIDKVSDAEKVLAGMGTHDMVPPLIFTSAASMSHITSTASVSQSSSSSCDNNPSIDRFVEKDHTPPLQSSRHDDNSGSNVDVILKIPIPRLKRKLQAMPSVKMDKFVNILPKLPNKKLPISRSVQANHQSNLLGQSSSPPPQVTMQPSSSLDLVTVTPQPPIIPKITVIPNSSSQVHIQPLSSSGSLMPSQSGNTSQPVVSTQSLLSSQSLMSSNHLASSSKLGLSLPGTTNNKTTTSTPTHITLIPMDNIPAVSHTHQGSKSNSTSVRMIAPSQVSPPKVSNSLDGVVEKDGLVMINSNLALRIVSSLPTTLDTTTTTTNTTTIHPITNPSLNNLTILPQVDGGKSRTSLRETVKSPDILTIVPQVDLSKRLSLLKNTSSVSSTPTTSCTTTTTTASSQVVKLYLLQSKESTLNVPKLKIPDAFTNLNGVEFKPLSINSKEREITMDEEDAKDECSSSDEGNERSMVIADIKEEVEEDLMDPLSLCAVTMEDEHLELSNHASPLSQSSVSITTVDNDKAQTDKMELKGRGKKDKLDIVKYEARKYVCCFCNRRFGWSTDLKRHVILHTGERPFQCKVCPTAFTRKFLLQNHMKRMHPDKCKMSDLWP
ncbi:uncharacterized protein [Macrobrachium rosenbergii]|uniref:uncharacterized protein n=1 Tax=Macrobrachium rosenbergii TaxID=79674 RepID=UPI0034D3A909